MSADSWQVCPNCEKLNEEKENKYWETVENSYGKIYPEEYEEKINNPPEFEIDETLAEYYEIGIDNSKMELFIRYSCFCNVCGFNYEYNTDIKINDTK